MDQISFVADRGDARHRLDQVLVRRIREISRMSRTVAQRWIEAGLVRVDGVAARRASVRVREGAASEVAPPATAVRRTRPEAEDTPLDVLYEDAYLLAVNKPPGLVVHPSYKRGAGTLLNAVLWRVQGRQGVQPGILTRLDKDTSGLVVIALHPRVHAAMQRDGAAGTVKKEYLAIVRGSPQPPSGRIVLPIGRDPQDRRRMMPAEGGMASETIYEVIDGGAIEGGSIDGGSKDPPLRRSESMGDTSESRGGRCESRGGRCESTVTLVSIPTSVVRCELVTGRTHQIRVHLAASGWPLVGDAIYGEASPAIARQALHAWRISMPPPVTRVPLTIEAPVPADMRALMPVRRCDQSWSG
jgi:23S rRNA pseudouridine1911/1915/1917 synthase